MNLKKYEFIGTEPKFYPDIVIPGKGSLFAEPGDVVAFETPPSDGSWFEVKAEVREPRAAKKTEAK
jgi:hypothetical protein